MSKAEQAWKGVKKVARAGAWSLGARSWSLAMSWREREWGEVQARLAAWDRSGKRLPWRVASLSLEADAPRELRRLALSIGAGPRSLSASDACEALARAAEAGRDAFEDARAAMDEGGKPWPLARGGHVGEQFGEARGEEAWLLLGVDDLSRWSGSQAGHAFKKACEKGQLGAALRVARERPDLATMDIERESALACAMDAKEAAQGERLALAQLLLSQGADPRGSQQWRGAPMSRAASHGDLACVKLLLGAGAPVEAPAGHSGAWTRALLEGHMDVARVVEQAQSPSQEDADRALRLLVERSDAYGPQAVALALPWASGEGVAKAAIQAGKREKLSLMEKLLPRVDPSLVMEAAVETLSESSMKGEMGALVRMWARSIRERQAIGQELGQGAARGSPKARL